MITYGMKGKEKEIKRERKGEGGREKALGTLLKRIVKEAEVAWVVVVKI